MKLRNPRSFIEPRAKSSFNIRDILLLSVVFLAISFVLYLSIKPSNKATQNTSQKSTNKNISQAELLSKNLPNHKKENLTIQKELTNLLSVVPYDMVLGSLSIQDGNSTIEGEIIYKDSYYKEIKPKLLKLYTSSTAQMYKTGDGTYSITIKNKKVKNIYLPKLIHQIYDIPKKPKSMNELKNDIKLMLPKNSIIRFSKEASSDNYIKNSFKISTYIRTPKELYNIIEKINNKNVCTVIENDMELNTYNSMIRINFIMSIYQIISDKNSYIVK
jgi:hypothetical protein